MSEQSAFDIERFQRGEPVALPPGVNVAKPKDEWRVRIYWLREKWFIDFIEILNSGPQIVSLHGCEDSIPDDAKVRSIWHDPMRGGWAMLLEHPSFDPVPDGCEARHRGPWPGHVKTTPYREHTS